MSSTLKLSADEQIQLLGKLWTGKLPVGAQARELTLKVMPTLPLTSGAVRQGKTGSGRFVGHLENHGHEYPFAMSFSGLVDGRTRTFGGLEARGLTTQILHELGLFCCAEPARAHRSW